MICMNQDLVVPACCLLLLAAHASAAGAAGGAAAFTIDTPQGGTYPVGDTLTFTGTNTVSGTTYLFVAGPGLKAEGSRIQSTRPGDSPVMNDDASSFAAAAVGKDGRWSWSWRTEGVFIDPGTYAVYAAASPRDRAHLNTTAFAKIVFMLGSPGYRAGLQAPSGNDSSGPARADGGTTPSANSPSQPSGGLHENTTTAPAVSVPGTPVPQHPVASPVRRGTVAPDPIPAGSGSVLDQIIAFVSGLLR